MRTFSIPRFDKELDQPQIFFDPQFRILGAKLAGSAVDALVIAAVGHGNAQIVNHAAVAVDQAASGGFCGRGNWGSDNHLCNFRLYRFLKLCRGAVIARAGSKAGSIG